MRITFRCFSENSGKAFISIHSLPIRMGNRQTIDDHIFNLRMSAKQLQREASKCDKGAQNAKQACLREMGRNNEEGARIYAENAIRDKNQALNYLRLASRIEGVASRVNTAARVQGFSKDIGSVVKAMDTVVKSMNVYEINKMMDKFQATFDDISLTTSTMEDAMQQSTASVIPDDQVSLLMQQVREENGLQFKQNLADAPERVNQENKEQDAMQRNQPMDDMHRRIENL